MSYLKTLFFDQSRRPLAYAIVGLSFAIAGEWGRLTYLQNAAYNSNQIEAILMATFASALFFAGLSVFRLLMHATQLAVLRRSDFQAPTTEQQTPKPPVAN